MYKLVLVVAVGVDMKVSCCLKPVDDQICVALQLSMKTRETSASVTTGTRRTCSLKTFK
ncbi:hypothetical protein EXN66_Car019540 [Channa argus]|uniref:Uncharacterized protein n=1 Tax=Channa argus TaxID=215402 RepID=A0A6G1QMP7_CHAAH|nr:hypothetical protein EXN66_Car019540 [Channa argus]